MTDGSEVSGVTPAAAIIDVVLPVLDEREAIPWVLERLPVGYRAIVVDNGSTDGSGDLATSLGANVVHETTKGFGSACYAGLMAATAPLVAFMDCDGSLDPEHLPLLVNRIESGAADLVIGARRPERGAWSPHARFANRALARQVRRRFDIALDDIGPMRVCRRDALIALGMIDRRSGWPVEMVLRAHRAGWRIENLPVPYLARSGKSKVTGTVRGTVTAVRDMRRRMADIERLVTV